MKDKELIRLSKLMSQKNLCSRREADRFIEQGLVKVNGIVIDQLGYKVSTSDCVTLVDAAKKQLKAKKSFILNKPLGYLSSPMKGSTYPLALSLLTLDNASKKPLKMVTNPCDLEGIGPVGRLDVNSKGLMLYTQDGVLAKKIIGEKSSVEKEYLVKIKGELDDNQLKLLNYGLKLDGEKLKPAKVKWLNEDQLQFILKQGKYRQIRRMLEAVNCEVRSIKRVRIGAIKLGSLKEGQWLELDSFRFL
jgi:23S rRNA pseudouridine2604 synthase